MSGSHRENGLFALSGAQVTRGELTGAAIADMAPTILSLCRVPVPASLDGRCLGSLGSGGAVADSEETPAREEPYAAGQERILRDRLARLGYLDT
jgi:hypothetical protein